MLRTRSALVLLLLLPLVGPGCAGPSCDRPGLFGRARTHNGVPEAGPCCGPTCGPDLGPCEGPPLIGGPLPLPPSPGLLPSPMPGVPMAPPTAPPPAVGDAPSREFIPPASTTPTKSKPSVPGRMTGS
jgi:hypothetical protein